jgi:hypothetical protein
MVAVEIHTQVTYSVMPVTDRLLEAEGHASFVSLVQLITRLYVLCTIPAAIRKFRWRRSAIHGHTPVTYIPMKGSVLN